MSKDSEEIKTIEQWKWSEMQGLELVPDAATSPQQQQGQVPREMETTREQPNKDVAAAAAPAATMNGGSISGEKAESVPSVGFGELFRFADGLDYVLMGIGTVGAVVHGCSLPLFLRFFADLVNSFGSNANDVDKMTQEVVKVTIKHNKHHRRNSGAFFVVGVYVNESCCVIFLQYAFYFLVVGAAIWASSWAGE